MSTFLETRDPSGSRLIPVTEGRMAVGTDPTNDIVVGTDRKVSRVHAVLELIAARWFIRDLGSRNGTYVNGERILVERPLRHGDEIRVGATRFVFRSADPAQDRRTATETEERPPEITRRESDILIALCRPLLSGDLLTEPATVQEIAAELVLTESAVKKHFQRLYDKFGIEEAGRSRRGRLANEAIRRGAVNIADLRGPRR